MLSNARTHLYAAIVDMAFVSGNDHEIVTGSGKENKWMFDMRKILLTPEGINAFVELFFATHKELYPFQVGGLESASIPLVAGIVARSPDYGLSVNGFFIRKSRKKTGLLNVIEGTLNEHPIILLDDIMNSGGSFVQQVELLEYSRMLGKTIPKIHEVFSVLRFRDVEQYTYFAERDIAIRSIFELNDFTKKLPVANISQKQWNPR